MQRNRKVQPFHWGEKTGNGNCERDQMLGLTEKDFKVAIMNMFTELQESMI